jgi:hypothetical protein
MQAIIAAELRERYDISEQLPSLERLFKTQRCALDGGAAKVIVICIGN